MTHVCFVKGGFVVRAAFGTATATTIGERAEPVRFYVMAKNGRIGSYRFHAVQEQVLPKN